MSYLSEKELSKLNFKYIGSNVKISSKASIYNPELIEIDDSSRIDDFCIISGNVKLGKFCHITPMCLLAGGSPGIVIEDYGTLAYGVKIFSQSDDYSGETMFNSLIPKEFKKEKMAPVEIKKFVIIGTNSVVFPGVVIEEGVSVGAMSLVIKDLNSWSLYAGIPVKKLKNKSKKLLKLEQEFLSNFK